MKTKKTKEQRRANDASSICAIESDCFSEMKEYRDNKRGNEKAAAIREVTISRTRNVLTPLTGRTIDKHKTRLNSNNSERRRAGIRERLSALENEWLPSTVSTTAFYRQ